MFLLFATHRKSITGRPNSCVPINAVNAIMCCTGSTFRRWTDTRWPTRRPRVHWSGASWYGHVSLRFDTCPLVTCLSGHISPQDCNTCLLVTFPRGTTECSHMSPPSCDTWHRPTCPHGPTELGHMSALGCDICRLRTYPCCTTM